MHSGIVSAILAALLFGASTPFAKCLVGEMHPVLLAGLLYLGAGIGLTLVYGYRCLRSGWEARALSGIKRTDVPWLVAAVALGGILGPLLLMSGLVRMAASSASLLLNLEVVFTAALAWFVFHESFDRRILIGMVCIVVGGIVLAWDSAAPGGISPGAIAVVLACLCWAVDNNLTRKISASDAVQIAAIKGVVGAAVNVAVAFAMGATAPGGAQALQAATIGFFGYGVSVALFVVSLRDLGTARTAAYFSVAPFFGALLALPLNREALTPALAVTGVLMGIGVWFHLTERHEHEHEHEHMQHTHSHTHDAHHQHEHSFPFEGDAPHTHAHEHRPLRHRHKHFPDIHHRHDH